MLAFAAELWPAAHARQAVLLGVGWYRPCAHGLHEMAPVALWYRPALQLVQPALPDAE